jgi:hypothetical protein
MHYDCQIEFSTQNKVKHESIFPGERDPDACILSFTGELVAAPRDQHVAHFEYKPMLPAPLCYRSKIAITIATRTTNCTWN